MKNRYHYLVVACMLSMPVMAIAGYDYVIPGEYYFGTCGKYGGDGVPTDYKSTKYYTRYDCNKAYNDGDRCYVTVVNYKRQMGSDMWNQHCGNFFNNEVTKCQNFVRKAGEWCSKLDK